MHSSALKMLIKVMELSYKKKMYLKLFTEQVKIITYQGFAVKLTVVLVYQFTLDLSVYYKNYPSMERRENHY